MSDTSEKLNLSVDEVKNPEAITFPTAKKTAESSEQQTEMTPEEAVKYIDSLKDDEIQTVEKINKGYKKNGEEKYHLDRKFTKDPKTITAIQILLIEFFKRIGKDKLAGHVQDEKEGRGTEGKNRTESLIGTFEEFCGIPLGQHMSPKTIRLLAAMEVIKNDYDKFLEKESFTNDYELEALVIYTNKYMTKEGQRLLGVKNGNLKNVWLNFRNLKTITPKQAKILSKVGKTYHYHRRGEVTKMRTGSLWLSGLEKLGSKQAKYLAEGNIRELFLPQVNNIDEEAKYLAEGNIDNLDLTGLSKISGQALDSLLKSKNLNDITFNKQKIENSGERNKILLAMKENGREEDKSYTSTIGNVWFIKSKT